MKQWFVRSNSRRIMTSDLDDALGYAKDILEAGDSSLTITVETSDDLKPEANKLEVKEYTEWHPTKG